MGHVGFCLDKYAVVPENEYANMVNDSGSVLYINTVKLQYHTILHLS